MLLSIDFGNTFISVSLNTLDIKLKEDSDIDELKKFNVDVQIYLVSEGEYEEFIMIDVNLSTIKNDDEEYLYEEDDLYFKPNNVRYYGIIQMNYIYDYYAFHLRPKAINNFFSRVMFKSIKKIYIFKEIEYWIFNSLKKI